MRPLPDIGVVILHGGDLARTGEARASLARAGHRQGETLAVVKACHAGEAGALEREFGPGRVLVENKESNGLASLLNRGVVAALEAGSDYVLILDASCRLEDNALAPLLIALEAQRFSGAACPVVVGDENGAVFSFGGRVKNWTGGPCFRLSGTRKDSSALRQWETAGYAPFQCVLFKREFLEDVGLFNEAYGSSAFDAELGLRASREHWSIIAVPQSVATISSQDDVVMDRASTAFEQARNPLWLLNGYGVPVKRLVALVVRMGCIWPLEFASNLFRGRFRATWAVIRGSLQGIFNRGFETGGHLAVPLKGRKHQVRTPAPSAFVMKHLI